MKINKTILSVAALSGLCLFAAQNSFAFGSMPPGSWPSQTQQATLSPVASSAASQKAYSEYGISIVPNRDLDSATFETAASLLLTHLEREYTPDFIKRTRLQGIVLFGQLLDSAGNQLGGLTLGTTVQVAVNLQSRLGAGTQAAIIESFDHELFHVIDFVALQSAAESTPSSQAFLALNEAGFVYPGATGETTISQHRGGYVSGEHFVSGYAAAALVEDKAETYAWFMYDPSIFMSEHASAPAVMSKLKIIRQMLDSLCPSSQGCALPREYRSNGG